MKIWILSGGEIKDYSRIRICEDDIVIAVDAGYKHAENLRITPDYAVGDFDTMSDGNIRGDCRLMKYPPEKDDTDTMLSAKLAIGLTENFDIDKIVICGALGGRIDHTIGNIQTLNYIAEKSDTEAEILGDNEIIRIQKCNTKKRYEQDGTYKYFSVLSLSEKSSGITIKGCKYNAENITMTNNFPLGLSNEITEKYAEITLENGRLLIIYTKNCHITI